MIVVDASVAVKWFFAEVASDAANQLLAGHVGELAGPDQLAVEVCSTLVREGNRDRRNRPGIEAGLQRWRLLTDAGDVRLHRHTPDHLARAAALALEVTHPFKDCIYLALAQDFSCALVTADVRFAERARPAYPKIDLI